MTSRLPISHLLIALLTVGACTPGPGPHEAGPLDTAPGDASTSAPAEHPLAGEVRAARNAFNRAIEERNVDAVRGLLAPENHLITGRSSQHHGIDEHLALWMESFERDPPDFYLRSPREVRVNAEWGLAEELGDWRGAYTTADGASATASGVYAAKWQRDDRGAWRLQSEVFTTLACDGPGGGCTPPDPIGR